MSLKGIVNEKRLWDSFLQELDSRIELAQKGMENATPIEDVYRYQGEIRAFRRLKQLKDKVNGPE